jgi:hypothetical protein
MGPYDLIFDTLMPSFSVIRVAPLTAVILRRSRRISGQGENHPAGSPEAGD